MALYYLPVLIRSDRYFVTRLENISHNRIDTDYNFVVHAEDRVLTPLLTIEDPGKIVLNQMAPSGKQDIPLRECHISLVKHGNDFELRKNARTRGREGEEKLACPSIFCKATIFQSS